MKRRLLSALLLGSAIASKAQIPTEMSNRFQTVMDSLSVNALTDTGETIGISYAVYIPGYGSWKGASGMASPNVAMTPDTTIGIASHTKLYTAVILLKLQELGLVSLDDKLSKYFTTPIQNVDMSATIRQLLKHEVGIFDPSNDDPDIFWGNVFDDIDHYWTYDEYYTMIEAPHFMKGTAYRYSTIDYTIAANIIENVTGKSYAHNLHQYITEPLGLTMTFDAATDTAALDNISESWSYTADNWWPRLGSVAAASLSLGDANIVATPEDVVNFYRALFNTSFLSEESMAELLDFENGSAYGLGIRHRFSPYYDADILNHGGSNVGFLSEINYDPKSGSMSFMAINSDQTNGDYGTIHKAYKDYFPKKINDSGIITIISPRTTVCIPNVAPDVVLKNFGSSDLTAATINYQVDSNAIQTFAWTGNLSSGQNLQIKLPGVTVAEGKHDLKVWTTAPNGGTEGNLYNDGVAAPFAISTTGQPSSFSEDFEGNTTDLITWNPKHHTSHQWGITHLSAASGSGSLVKNNAQNDDVNSISYIDLPKLHLGTGAQKLTFKYAYSHPEGWHNSLQILISDDCGMNWTSLFNKEDKELSMELEHEPNVFKGYFPHNNDEWHDVNIPLDLYANKEVLIRFKEGTISGGNLFLDDIYAGASATMAVADLLKNDILVYPNPASDKVMIKGVPDGTSVTLYNLTGQKLIQVTAGGETSLDVSKLVKGVYILNTIKGSVKMIKK